MDKPKCILTVDVEAWDMRAPDRPVDTLIYGRINGAEWGIGRMMDIADRHGVKMTFFLDFTEVELYGDEIIEAGKYIDGRGHDLQLHCHYEVLVDKVLERFLALKGITPRGAGMRTRRFQSLSWSIVSSSTTDAA